VKISKKMEYKLWPELRTEDLAKPTGMQVLLSVTVLGGVLVCVVLAVYFSFGVE